MHEKSNGLIFKHLLLIIYIFEYEIKCLLQNQDNKDDAIKNYKLGIEELMLGMAIDLKGDDVERGKRIQDKMESNLMMAIDRVHELSKN